MFNVEESSFDRVAAFTFTWTFGVGGGGGGGGEMIIKKISKSREMKR